ncbi:MAG: hypothetical protein IJ008_00525 [Clostridia bacterium]|nr:hypothetical protein [Clostridia bacterium]
MSIFININQNKSNTYLSDVSFPRAINTLTRQIQEQKFLENVLSLIKNPYIEENGNVASKIKEDMKNNPQSYPISINDFTKALKMLSNAILVIYHKISKGIYSSNIFKYGYPIINDNFYNDIVEKRINRFSYVNMIYQISSAMQRFV